VLLSSLGAASKSIIQYTFIDELDAGAAKKSLMAGGAKGFEYI